MQFLLAHWKKLIVGTALLGAAGVADITLQPDPITVKLEDPQQIVWNKPTTDEGWAEDVKAENFDIKSSDVLNEMVAAHTAKLTKIANNNKKLTECPECVKYDLKTAHPEWKQQDIENEFQNELNQAITDVEKLQQSVERMQHELDLRSRGVVVPDKKDKQGTPTKQSDLQKVAPEMVRHIND